MPDGSELLEEFSNHKTEQKGEKKFGVNTVNESNLFDCESFDSALLSQNEKEQLRSLLNEYNDVFQKPNQPLGATNILKHQIRLV